MFSISGLADRVFSQLGEGPGLDERTLVLTALWFALINSGGYCLLPAPGMDMHWNFGATLGYALLLMMVRWGLVLKMGTHALLVMQFAQLASLSAYSGGINSPYIACLPLLPVSALLLLNIRWALVWLFIISAQNYLQYIAVNNTWIDGTVNTQTVAVPTVLLIKLNALIFMVLSLSLYDWTYRRKINKLASDNQELNRIESGLQQANTKIDALVACVADAIRAPIAMQLRLHPILMAELASESGHREAALQLKGETSKLLQAVDDVIDLASASLSRHEFTLTSFFLAQALQSASTAYMSNMLGGRLPVTLHLDPSVLVWVHADRDRLIKSIRRLLTYASQHADTGNIDVRFHFADTRVVIEVQFSLPTNRSVAMSSPLVSSATPSALPHGHDLGLAVCENLAAAAGGQFCVYLRGPNKLLLWLAWPLSPQPLAASPPTPGTVTRDTNRRFLVLEHVLPHQLEIQALLKKRWPQCHVGLAESASNALLQMEFSHYDMVLINLDLPQTDGIEATRRIRAHALPGIRSTPVVGLASKAQLSERHACLASGMQWMMFKPLVPEVFFAVISAHLAEGADVCVQ